MKLFISLVIVWTLSGSTLAEANVVRSVGDLRSACKDIRNMDTTVDALYSGFCLGWVRAESTFRSMLCVGTKSEDNLIGSFGIASARDTAGHSIEALMQGFLNWADDNPQFWFRDLGYEIIDDDFWSEFPCKAAN